MYPRGANDTAAASCSRRGPEPFLRCSWHHVDGNGAPLVDVQRNMATKPSCALSVDLVRAARRSETFPKNWPPGRLRQAVTDYLRFLALAKKHPSVPLAPTRDIDLMWHLHMLHPVAYGADCKRILGFVLDHDGGFGATPEELPLLQQAFATTAELWLKEYGQPYVGPGSGATKCVRNCQSRCWHACKSKRS